MQSISKHQFQLLKNLNSVDSIYIFDIPQEDFADYNYLASLGLAKWKEVSRGVSYNGIKLDPQKISISIHPGGKAYLDYISKDNLRFRLPLIFSGLAVLIALASIVLSPYFNVFFTKLYGL